MAINITDIRFWCQKILPAVYDDSLSYYELLAKLVAKLNEVIEVANFSTEAWEAVYEEIARVESESKTRDEVLQSNIDKVNDNLQKQITSNDDDIAALQQFDKEFYTEYKTVVNDIYAKFDDIASLMLCYDPTTGRYTDSANAMRRMLQLFINLDDSYTCDYITKTYTVQTWTNSGSCGSIINKDFQYNINKMPQQEIDGHSVADISQLTLQEMDVDELASKPTVVVKKKRSPVMYGNLIVGLLRKGIGVIKE